MFYCVKYMLQRRRKRKKQEQVQQSESAEQVKIFVFLGAYCNSNCIIFFHYDRLNVHMVLYIRTMKMRMVVESLNWMRVSQKQKLVVKMKNKRR